MDLPASLRELNPVIDRMARGEVVPDGQHLRFAVALGLVTPHGSLSEAGRAYARPALPEGALSLVMTPERQEAATRLLAGTLPLQASLRRLVQQVAGCAERLVAPASLGWSEGLLWPYLTYLEDLGLLVPIGPLVEVTPRGLAVAAVNPSAVPRPPLEVSAAPASPLPRWEAPLFRYLLVRRICLDLLVLRGRREWHRLDPLLEGPLAPLGPAYAEWLARFQAAQPSVRRSWAAHLVACFAARLPEPTWFADWCRALLGTGPDGALEAIVQTPGLLTAPVILRDGPLSRECWLVAVALAWGARRNRALRYADTARRVALDGLKLPPWPDICHQLEESGLMVSDEAEPRLLLKVEVSPPAAVLWPYAGAEWLAAALLEGHGFAPAPGGRRVVRV